jgi:lipid A disaccharide synthetase
MQTTVKRTFSSQQKTVCILANSRQADLTASKLMTKLRDVSGDSESINFTGYGGPWMAKEGFEPTVDIDINELMDKTFVTYRKTKTFSHDLFWRWNPWNLVNKHYTRSTDQVFDQLLKAEMAKKIYQSRPDLILNVDNEYMTFMLMDEIKKYYKNSAVDMPQRHYLNRFVRDFRQWTEQYVDHMHYTVPLTTATGDNYQFPGEYIGQYGAYEAVKHIYNSNANLKHLVSECGNELNLSKKYFASDLEKGINSVRAEWRAKNEISDDSTVIFFAPGNERTEA